MQHPTLDWPPLQSGAGRGGFSLLEMIIVVVVIGVMVTIAAPSYRRAVQQSRVDIAGANLRAIWAAERLFWLQNQTYTNDLSQLQALGLLDPKLPITDQTADNQYWDTYFWYTVTLGSTPNTFTANANVEPSRGTSNLQIDQTGTLQGNVTPCGSSAPITAVDFW